jgi:LPXTG-site transpeptidase (sortase) family protein
VSAAAAAMPARTAAPRRFPVRPFVIAAVSLLAALVLAFIGSNAWASWQQRDLSRRFEAAMTSWANLDPVGRSEVTVKAGAPLARIGIPSIGLDAIVVEGATPAAMRRAPGHVPGSAIPGEAGVALITSNRFGFGGFFLRLDRIAVDDRIVVESPFGETVYTVTEVDTVPVTQLPRDADSAQRVLVLFGSSRVVGGSDRLVVKAVAGGA